MLSCPKCGSSYSKELERCGLDGERLVQEAHDLLIGRTIDRYQILDLLGDGGMARVYRAKQIYLGQECAIKVLFGEVASDRSLARRFQREAQASSQIRHPNIVHIFDFGQTAEGLIFMAMELLRGRTLSDAIREDGALSPARAAYLARQIADGLAAAHALGFVHRDLKPKNVMLTGERGREVAKILDFGLVLITSASSIETTSLTQQGQVFGTPAYMAPEQVSGTDVGPAADLYALGVIIYQMLTGKVPFGGTPAQVALHHVSAPPPPLEEHGGLGALAMRCLSKKPDERPASALEIVRLIDELEIVSVRPPVAELSSRPVRVDPALIDARPEPAVALPLDLAAHAPPGSGGADAAMDAEIDAPIESSQDSLPPLSVAIDDSGNRTPPREVERTPPEPKEAALDEVLEDAGLGVGRRVKMAVVVGAAILGVAAGALYLRTRSGGAELARDAGASTTVTAPISVDGGGVGLQPASATTREVGAPRATSDAGTNAPGDDRPDERPREDVADAGMAGAAEGRDAGNAADAGAKVDKPAARDGGASDRPPKPRTRRDKPRDPNAPLVDPALVTARDRTLANILAKRGLAWADLGMFAPEAAKQWALWRIGADRPTQAELDDTQLELEQALQHIDLDAHLLEVKLDRVRSALADVPEARRDDRYQKLLDRYQAAAHQLGRHRTANAASLAAELTALEAAALQLSKGG